MKRSKVVFPFLIFFCFAAGIKAQNVGIGTTSPHDKAILHVASDDKGLLIPVLDQTEEDILLTGIEESDKGLLFYNSALDKFRYYGNGVHTLLSQNGNGILRLTNSSQNRLNFLTAGISPPNQEAGWKITLFDDGSTLGNRSGFGIDSQTSWSNVSSTGQYEWYHGTGTLSMRLKADELEIMQDLYIDQNMGIGFENPAERLYVNGNAKMTEKVSVGEPDGNVATQAENLRVAGDKKIEGNLNVTGNISTPQDVKVQGDFTVDNEKPFLLEHYSSMNSATVPDPDNSAFTLIDTGKSVAEYDAMTGGFAGGQIGGYGGLGLMCEMLHYNGTWHIRSGIEFSQPMPSVIVVFVKKELSTNNIAY